MPETDDTAREVEKARDTLTAAQKRHEEALRRQTPPKHVSTMTDAERKAEAKKRGFTGSF